MLEKNKYLYIFRHIQTNQVLLSQGNVLKKTALFQLPYPLQKPVAPNGMRPAKLRKDHWVPLLKVEFPNESMFQSVFMQLLNYRKYRSVQPLTSDLLKLPIPVRRRKIMRQEVPNTIADLADILNKEKFPENSVRLQLSDKSDSEYADWPPSVQIDSEEIKLSRGFREKTTVDEAR
ncbi:Mhr1 protein [Schizosaccharomyces pombe]|uniref:Large ribosomal subunit protein mL67 n=1 Tax=Schizosaccharomyces pombe (strain 972 / ATCC 24843) TaxID=284812 RepID=MHR1_SCHPO|nr:putative recombinase Mhr1 [Schizosaccharomyces pombe]O60147.1 RecName: Full=Large ribosomal subunit protein mL67; AltName: Full=Mitochondrial homologous recombination protein 1 [Schizosaccharomyces pombe 972h-]CAA18414.1 mitochondrial recombinase Mhr1 (predicted) [Schizosaccharomyces pombe]|eukprot:NP_595741.1 putative recombinase Mhr1 [Schizosaccharomyces pombe]